MRKLNYDHSFDRISLLFTAIGYFDDDQNEKIFRNIYKALKPNGIFCFDSHNRDTFMTYYLPSYVLEREGNLMIYVRKIQLDLSPFVGRWPTKGLRSNWIFRT